MLGWYQPLHALHLVLDAWIIWLVFGVCAIEIPFADFIDNICCR